MGVLVGAYIPEHFDNKRTVEEMTYKLMRSAYECDRQEAKWLIEDKTNVTIKSKSGFTPLHWVAWSKSRARRCRTIAEWLIQAGAEVNNASNSGLTPLHLAAEGHHRSMVKLLLCYGTQINATNEKKQTPLHLAIENKSTNNRERTVKVLVQAGANLELTDKNGKTPRALIKSDKTLESFIENRVNTNKIKLKCPNQNRS